MEVIESVRDNRKTHVESGHGVGKTNVAATTALWFLYNWPDSIVLTTAPTVRQVEGGLWKEIAIQHHPGLGGKLTHLKLKVDGERWFAMGFTARQSADAERTAASMQGFHAPNILVIFDEAAGVLAPFWTAANSLMSNANARFLVIGNPTSVGTKFHEASLLPTYNHIRISCFDHPNVVHNREIIAGAVTNTFIEDARTEWGEGTPMWQSRILGIPPDEGDDSLIRLSWVEAAFNADRQDGGMPRILACDVARHGTDRTTLGEIRGTQLRSDVEEWQGKDTVQTSGRIIKRYEQSLIEKAPYDFIVIDDGGVGGGVTDQLRHTLVRNKPMPVYAFNFGGGSSAEEFTNLRMQAYWKLREDIRTGQLSLTDVGTLAAELTSLKYGYDAKGKMKLESKEDMRRQGKRSPDYADMVCMANWVRTRGISESKAADTMLADEKSHDTTFGDLYSETF